MQESERSYLSCEIFWTRNLICSVPLRFVYIPFSDIYISAYWAFNSGVPRTELFLRTPRKNLENCA